MSTKVANTEKISLKRNLEEAEIVPKDSVEVKSALVFPAAKKEKFVHSELRKLSVPPNRLAPLRKHWESIYTPVVEQLKLQIRFNVKSKNVELKTNQETEGPNSLQKGADFIQAFIYGFDVEDCLALIRLDDLYMETFDARDVKTTLQGDHLSRAVGRVAGKGGKTKFTIENTTRTRITLADNKVHILGSFQNIQIARRAICNLILGSPPSKIYGNLKSYAERIRDK